MEQTPHNTTVLQPTGEKDVIAVTQQDCEPILEHNKMLRGVGQKSDWGRHVARVPNNVLYGWLVDEWNRGNLGMKMSFTPGSPFMTLVEIKLNDPDWAFLRVDKQPSGHAWIGPDGKHR